MADFVRVAAAADVPAGQGMTVEVRGKQIALFNCDGTFYAVDNTCKHQGGPLGEGELDGVVVTCPWHGWTYDVTTGVSPDDSDCAVGCYAVTVEGGDVLVAV
ncbi:MAG: Rieske (2Fe-2S) protein [Candidatus Binatia bacterium]